MKFTLLVYHILCFSLFQNLSLYFIVMTTGQSDSKLKLQTVGLAALKLPKQSKMETQRHENINFVQS